MPFILDELEWIMLWHCAFNCIYLSIAVPFIRKVTGVR